MKKILVMALFLILATSSFAYLYYGLINTDDSLTTPGTPNALHTHIGFYHIGMLNKAFNAHGTSYDVLSLDNNKFYNGNSVEYDNIDGSYYDMLIPVTVGYNVEGMAEVNATIILRNRNGEFTGTNSGTTTDFSGSAFGPGDLWISAKGIFQVGENWFLGPQIGFKAAVGESDDTDITKTTAGNKTTVEETFPLGDGQHDIDFGLWIGKSRESGKFRSKINIGFRHRLGKTIEVAVAGGTVTEDYAPGMQIYMRALPGFAITPQFETYLVLDYINIQGTTYESTTCMGFAVGIAPAYIINANSSVNAEIQYPLFGNNIYRDIMLGVNYDGYITF